MKIAVTGGTGFVGRAFIKQLIDSPHQLRCWCRNPNDLPFPDHPNIDWLQGQLNDENSTQALVAGCDAVVHSALWRVGIGFRQSAGTSGSDMIDFLNANFMGTIRLIEASRAAGVKRFVFISTCAVHEKILDDRPLDESHPTWAKTHYGAHKAALECFVHSYGWGQDFSICALRPTGIYGVAHPPEGSKYFDLVKRVVFERSVTTQGGGKEVHVDDVAKAIILLLNAENVAGEAFNCYDRYVSQNEVASLAKEFSGGTCEIIGEATTPKHQIETSKIKALGMEFGGEELLRQTIGELVELVAKTANRP